MSKILSIYYYMNNAVGLFNIHYNSLTNTYNLNHWPTFTYCVSFNILMIIMLQFTTYTYCKLCFSCEPVKPLMIFSVFLFISNYALFTSIVAEGWHKRQRIYKICNKFKNLFKYYLCDKSIQENHDITISTPVCPVINHTVFVASNISFGIITLNIILLDLNIYMGLLLIQMCVQMLVQRLRNIRNEIHLMHRLQRNGQAITHKLYQKWRQMLNQHIILIARDADKLKSLAEELFSIYQLPLLFLILTYFLGLLLVNNFKEIGQLVYQIGVYDFLGTRDISLRDDLALSLESFLLQIQYREIKFSVCGIFVINNSSCMILLIY
ncbi:hypothetical protein FF38_09878 [Lucilia cuprina]|uniref:Gustatory receptor n=1 Tax=Lucilia cuprina TaxID=7375 RepID=A0A0L0CMB6_LUCCU|nr:hypothetical protein FF38_09878 [Lucilia cuprina]